MPCGCFGGKKVREVKEDPVKVGQGNVITSEQQVKSNEFEDLINGNNKKNGLTAGNCDDGGFHGYRTSGSRPSSSYVDSPNTHSHTPSTIPAEGSSRSSSPSTPPEPRKMLTPRALLAKRRREFFRELEPHQPRLSLSDLPPAPSTLPTIARARQFGKVRPMRPSSQPSTPSEHPDSEAYPPGPHLLHHHEDTNRNYEDDVPSSDFADPQFLQELQKASNDISQRWAMSDEEQLKMRDAPPGHFVEENMEYTYQETNIQNNSEYYRQMSEEVVKPQIDRSIQLQEVIYRENNEEICASIDLAGNKSTENANINMPASATSIPLVSLSSSSHSSLEECADNVRSLNPAGVPETLVTPPSPCSFDSPSHSPPDSPLPLSDEEPNLSNDVTQHTFEVPEPHPERKTRIEQRETGVIEEEDEEEENDDAFDDMMKNASKLNEEQDSFDICDEEQAFINPHAEGGPLFSDHNAPASNVIKEDTSNRQ